MVSCGAPLLRQASNEELEPLVRYIVEKGGVTAQIDRTRAFRQHSPSGNHQMYADDIAAEIQKFGANTFWSQAFRNGRGTKYRNILKSVAKRCGVKAGFWDETVEIEERVLVAVLSKAPISLPMILSASPRRRRISPSRG